MSDAPPDEKRQRWQVDPRIFEKKKYSLADRLVETVTSHARMIGKYLAYSLLIIYPLILVITGVMWGGLAYYSGLVGSILLISFLLTRLGYAPNFAGRKINLWRSTFTTSVGFMLALGWFLGLINLKEWFVPVAFGVLVLVFVIGMKIRGRNEA